ncbi:hypothetical protein DZ860_03285 [Vibrio sinensis]|uniref:Competence protein CoiA n=1 Tax=Vibrio sinensis TaxID=2302434 RepID=A0A3A6REZ7_9VIBR|nr:hypothetical protein [Vibrio sinensis]RJX75712.1 hypothetical protein DZ860_03285 [Vibrio sinensis]
MNKTETNTSAFGLFDTQLMHIDDVMSGLGCNCNCISCGDKLVAKKGDVKRHHFAHHSMDASECSESVLHRLCKHILERERRILAPEFHPMCSKSDLAGIEHHKEEIFESEELSFNEVLLEQAEADFIPDVTAVYDDRQRIFIEIVVTNDVSEEKLEKVKRLGVPMMAVYVNELDIMDDLDSLTLGVIEQAPRKWIYHPVIEQIQSRLQNELDFDISLLNERMRLAVIKEQGEKTCHENISFKQHQMLLLGYNSAYGYSRKKARNFDFSVLYVTKPLRSSCSANYTVRANGGHEAETVNFDDSLLPQLSKMNFPCIVELGIKPVFVAGRPVTMVDSITVC